MSGELTAATEPAPLSRAGAANRTSLRAGSKKQLFPVSSNFRHLARVLFMKAKATGLETLESPNLAAALPRVAYQYNRGSFSQCKSVTLIFHDQSTVTAYY